MFKLGTKIEYEIEIGDQKRRYYGECVEVTGYAGKTQVRVKNIVTQKARVIDLDQITGIVREN